MRISLIIRVSSLSIVHSLSCLALKGVCIAGKHGCQGSKTYIEIE